MSPIVRSIVIGFVVALLVGAAIGFLAPQVDTTSVGLFAGGLGVFAGYIAANLSGNKRVAKADEGARSAALALTPPAGQATIIVFREGFVAKAAGMDIALDGRNVVQLKAPRFAALNVAPGPHTIGAALGGLAGAQNTDAKTKVDLKAGEVAVLRLTVTMGLVKGKVGIERIADPAAATGKLRRMTMVAAEI